MAITFVNGGTAAGGVGTGTLSPGVPASIAVGDVMLLLVGLRSRTATINTPSGWTVLQNITHTSAAAQFTVFWRVATSSESSPSVTASSSAVTDDFFAKIAAFRGVNTTTPLVETGTTYNGGTTQNVGSITGITIAANNMVVVIGFKTDDCNVGTGYGTLSGDSLTWAEISEQSSTTGNDASMAWDYAIDGGSGTVVTNKTFTVTGGTSNPGLGVMLEIAVGVTAYTLTASTGSFSLSGQVASLKEGHRLAAAAGTFAETGQAANLLVAHRLTASAGTFALTGQAANLLEGHRLTAATGNYTLTGQSSNLLMGHRLSAATGSYVLTGQGAGLLVGHVLTSATGSYAVAGQDAGLLAGHVLSATSGSYAVTGQDANLLAAHVLTGASGSYVVTGQDALLARQFSLSAAAGSYVVTGQSATLNYSGGFLQYTLTAAVGSVTVIGQSANLLTGRQLTAATGSLVVTGQDATLLYLRLLTLLAQTGAYVVTGQPATLTHSGALPPNHGPTDLGGLGWVTVVSGQQGPLGVSGGHGGAAVTGTHGPTAVSGRGTPAGVGVD